jgi:hypothetical protein
MAQPPDLFFQISIAGLYPVAISETIALPGLFLPKGEMPSVLRPVPEGPTAAD